MPGVVVEPPGEQPAAVPGVRKRKRNVSQTEKVNTLLRSVSFDLACTVLRGVGLVVGSFMYDIVHSGKKLYSLIMCSVVLWTKNTHV